MADTPSSPLVAWTPTRAWLQTALTCELLEAATSPELGDAVRLAWVGGQEGVELVAALPFAGRDAIWLRLRVGSAGHPWRDSWRVRIFTDVAPSTVVELAASQPSARLSCRDATRLHVRLDVEARFARCPALPLCEPVPVSDAAYHKHVLQSSAASNLLEAARAGKWMVPTEAEAQPWWQLDLGEHQLVDHVRIHCAAPVTGHLSFAAFAYHRPDGAPAAPWQQRVAIDPGAPVTIEVGQVARYVRVTLQPDGAAGALHLAAVEVFVAPLAGDTLLDSVRRSFTLFANRPLFGQREPDDHGQLGGYDRWVTYAEVWTRVVHLANGLAQLLEPASERIFVGLCASNRPDWVIADLAAILRGYVVVPLAHTDPPERLAELIERTSMQIVVCAPALAPMFDQLAARLPCLRFVIEMAPLPNEPAQQTGRLDAAELERRGASEPARPPAVREESELYSILFTSGSTGKPKGAMRSYAAFNAMVAGYSAVQPAVHLSFQPLSHLSERMMLPTLLQHGGRIGFFSGDAARLFDDVSRLQPTVFGGVPRVLDVLRAQFLEALALRRRTHPAEDDAESRRKVLAQVRAILGSRLQSISVGSAKPSDALLAFMRECFADCWVTEGYGSTEVGTISVNGVVQPDVEVKLVDVPELGYLTSDDPPRGELYVRTPHMIAGYFGDTGAAGAVDTDGYFRTGDIGVRRSDGRIELIGRRKDVVKLAHGEFVAPETIESALLACPLVEQIYVDAQPERAWVIAVVVPNRQTLADVAGDDRQDAAALCQRLRQAGSNAGLAGYELPGAVHVASEAMTVANGLLTSSGKPNRAAIAAHYRDALDALYEASAAPNTLQLVRDAAASVLGDAVDGAAMHELGVDSLASVRLVSLLSERLGRPVPLQAWFAAASLEELAQRLDSEAGAGPAAARADLAIELPTIDATLPAAAQLQRAVLLTGATGFLGRGLLEALLDKTDASITCIVRAADDAVAWSRLRAHLEDGGIALDAAQTARVRAISGDLAQPSLGLDPQRFQQLASEVDTIVHAAAHVSWISPYDAVRAPNVLGTLEVIRLATTARLKPLHFVSTISTAPGDGDETSLLPLEQAERASGYALSKWIAEHHVRAAAAQGLPVTVYRPAMIAGHSARGIGNAGDFISRYLAGSAQLGLYLDIDDVLDMTPVDFVSEAIVALAKQPCRGRTYHLVNLRQSLSYRAIGAAMREAGIAVRPAAYDEFRAALLTAFDSDNALAPLASYFPPGGFALAMGPWPNEETARELDALGVRCPAIDTAMIARYVSSLGCRGPTQAARER